MLKTHLWSGYIIQKCFFLSGLLLTSALILLVWTQASPHSFPLCYRYALYFMDSSLIVLAAGLFGGFLLEDMLRGQR